MAQASPLSPPQSRTPEEAAAVTSPAPPAVSSVTVDVNAAPRGQTRKAGRARPDHCLNCGRKSLTTRFCPDCGQENTPHAVSVGQLLGDILEEFVKWDGRLFRSLALLMFFPGRLTKEYNAGRRVNYVSPFKMYFVVSALFVFILSFQTTDDLPLLNQFNEAEQKIQAGIAKENAGKTTKRKFKTATPTKNDEKKNDEKKTGDETIGLQINPDNDGGLLSFRFTDDIPFPKHYKIADGSKLKAGNYEKAYLQWQSDDKNKHRHGWLIKNALQNMCHAVDAPGAYIRNVVQKVGHTMFFLLPAYAFLLALFFFRSRRYYVEHLILAVNNHTMAFFILTAANLAMHRFAPFAGFLIASYWLYELISFKIVYGRGWIGTISRQGLVWGGYALALILGLVAAMLITLVMPS